MTANLNLMTKHLSPILPLTCTASRVSAVWFEPLLKACDFLFAARVAFWVILILWRNGSPTILILCRATLSYWQTSRPLCSLEVKTRPNCLGRSKNPSAEQPERQVHSWATMTRYEHFWRPSRYEIISHPWIRSGDCLYSPFQLYDASLGASAVENGLKTLLQTDYLPIRACLCSRAKQTTVKIGDVTKNLSPRDSRAVNISRKIFI